METNKNLRFFLNYDLNFNGDYDGLYKWLDDHNAKNCGQNFCEFFYSSDNKVDSSQSEKVAAQKTLKSLESDLTKSVSLKRGDRIYLIGIMPDGMSFGGFLTGDYGPKPWAGYGQKQSENSKISFFN